ncbi:hypothetical protein DH2020_028829 [Rehmannia glutinosa]|uniref:BTB domain-containing protein n=1 Tax=Rehmannia glutinosa TaxID=99300 RepID=A0ABR0VQ84_REHGL
MELLRLCTDALEATDQAFVTPVDKWLDKSLCWKPIQTNAQLNPCLWQDLALARATVLEVRAKLMVRGGQFDIGDDLIRKAVFIRTSICGEDHPDTISARDTLSKLTRLLTSIDFWVLFSWDFYQTVILQDWSFFTGDIRNMPPFAGSNPFSNGFHHDSNSNIVTVNVGGHLFQTTKQTLSLAGPKSLFSKISNSNNVIPFIDRDPEIFSILLSLLRTGNLPSKAKSFATQDLIFESRFYGIENLLINSQSSPFDAFNLEKSLVLPLNGRDSPSAISTTPCGSLHVAHGSKITSFDWSLQKKSTTLTQFTAIDSLLALSPKAVAAGATDFSGLQIIDLEKGFVKETLNWENVTKSGSTVQAIGASHEHLFTSFESSRRNSNCIMVYDLNDPIRPVTKIGHYEIFGADLNSAIPATKLQWVSSHNLLMASGSHSGPFGVLGNIKFWDIRSGNVVWEIKENVDCFSDVTVSDNLSLCLKLA